MSRWFIYWLRAFNSLMARGEETVTEPRCPTVDAAKPARVQHGKQSVLRVDGVGGDALGSG